MSGCDDCGEDDCSCDTYEDARIVATKPQTCCECRRPIAVGETFVEAWGVYDGHDWSESTCVPCEALQVFARDLAERQRVGVDYGPAFGETVSWLEEYEVDIATMPPAVASHYLVLLAAQNESFVAAQRAFAERRRQA